MKAFTKFLMPALALAAAGIVGSMSSVQAQQTGSVFGVAVGQVVVCSFTGPISITQAGRTYAGTVTGSGTFQVNSFSNFDPAITGSRNTVSYFPTSIQATSTFPELGTGETSLDAAAPAAISATSSVNPGPAAFPATSAMSYNAVTTIGGVRYASQGVVNFVSNNVVTAFPFVNERFDLAGPVQFGNAANGFTLNTLTSTFNNNNNVPGN